MANAQDSTACVYLTHNILPDLDRWPSQFASTANGRFVLYLQAFRR
jgi:hypothetical protein